MTAGTEAGGSLGEGPGFNHWAPVIVPNIRRARVNCETIQHLLSEFFLLTLDTL